MRVVRNIELTDNSKICRFLEFWWFFKYEKFCEFVNFPIWEIRKISNFENSKSYYNRLIWEMIQLSKLMNWKN